MDKSITTRNNGNGSHTGHRADAARQKQSSRGDQDGDSGQRARGEGQFVTAGGAARGKLLGAWLCSCFLICLAAGCALFYMRIVLQ